MLFACLRGLEMYSCVWHDWFICEMWLVHMCHVTPFFCMYDVTLAYVCDMPDSYVWHHSFDLTLVCVCHASFTRVTWLIRRDSCICVTRPSDKCSSSICVTRPSHVCNYLTRATQSSYVCRSSICVTRLSHLCNSIVRLTRHSDVCDRHASSMRKTIFSL